MALMRAALTKIFPDLDKILSLDVDTIINENISELWEIDLTDYYFAACREPDAELSSDTYFTINAGVMMINLDKLRQDKKDDEIINALNTKEYKFDVQDAYPEFCQGHIYELAPDYNVNDYTDYKKARFRKIIHYAGIKDWFHFPIVQKYFNLPVYDLVYDERIYPDLDIIIPSYNNLKGLQRTLRSLYYEELLEDIHIYVIDDASDIDYEPILKEFPRIRLYKLKENGGPGHARKVGIEISKSPYLMFVDCGDIILSKYCLLAIQDTLMTYRMPEIYEWSWINGDTQKASASWEPSTPGKIYKREFLELYNIYPYSEGPGSYAAEDCGVNNTCFAIIQDYEYYESTCHMKYFQLPIYKSIAEETSLTRKNNKEFWYTQMPGVVANCIYCIDLCERANVHTEIILEKLNLFIVDMYFNFLRTKKNRPDLIEEQWHEIRKFYLEKYSKYENEPENESYRTMYMSTRMKLLRKYTTTPNIRRFLKELKEKETFGGD